MNDTSNRPAMPQEGGDKNSANKKASEKRAKNPKKHLSTTNLNTREKTEIIVLIFGIIEIISLVLWQLADVFHGFADSIHWLSICGFIAGAAYLLAKAF